LASEAHLSRDTEYLKKVDNATQKLEPDHIAALSIFRGQAEIGLQGLIEYQPGLTQFTERSLDLFNTIYFQAHTVCYPIAANA